MNLSLALLGLLAAGQASPIVITNHTGLPKGLFFTEARTDFSVASPVSQSKTLWRVKLVGDRVEVTRLNADQERERMDKESSAFNPKNYPAMIKEDGGTAYVGPMNCTKVDDGWLYTLDFGEWGGGLYWFSSDFKEQKKIFKGNLREILMWNGKRYAIGGLDYVGTVGHMVLIEKTAQEGWTATKVFSFDSCPLWSQVDPQGNLLVVTSSEVYRVTKKGEREKAFKSNSFFIGPSSVTATKNGTIYIGQPFYLVRLRPQGKGYREEWMAPLDEAYRIKR